MLKKYGDLNPVRIVNTTDIDVKSTKKHLKKVIQEVKELEKDAKKENEVENKDKK